MVSRVACLLASLICALLCSAAPAVAGGTGWALGDPMFPGASLVAPTAPVNTAAPSIGGTIATGSTLTSSLGTWTQSPTTFTYQWQTDSGSGFADIAGATTSTYTLASADTGAQVRVVVTAGNAQGTTSQASPGAGPVDAAVPTNFAPPTVAGTLQRTKTLLASTGTWNPTATYAYQWERDSGSGFAPITGATLSTHVLAVADVGTTLRVVVTATNANGASTATSAATAVIQPLLPTSTSSPTIAGTARRTFTLAATSGVWTPSGVALAYQWQHDVGSGWTDITGATASTYTLATGDVGGKVRVSVSGTNVDGTTWAYSAASATVLGAVPVTVSSPLVAGRGQVGQTLTTSNGAWNPAATSYAYQWQRDSGAGFSDITGETTSSYAIVSADAGSRLRVVVTATNAEGTGTATSAATGVITDPPTFTTQPSITYGTLEDTAVVTADPGVWTPSSAGVTYQWVRCPVGASAVTPSCLPVGVSQSYRLTAQDVGRPMGVRVTASYAGGSTAAASAVTPPVDGRALTSVVAPAVGGIVQVAETAKATPGTWSVATTTVKYQWQRCAADGTGCTDIPGAQADRYAVGLADRGHQLAVREIATSPGRTASATSIPALVDDQPLPAATTLPAILGILKRTGTLNVTTGEWANKATHFSFQWQRCDSDGSNCADVAGATGSSLGLTATDVGHAITATVYATNTAGTVGAGAAPTAPVAGIVPVLRTAPTIAGTPQVPNTVQAIRMAWVSTSDTRYTYQWQRCAADGTGCVPIASATRQQYKLQPADADHTLRVDHVATNSDATRTGTSAPTPVIKPPLPSVGTYPRLNVSGTPVQVGRTLTLTPATWFNAASTVAQFWRCAPRCVELATSGATTYTLAAADAGAILRASERATGPGGTTTAYAPQYFGPVRSGAVASSLSAMGSTATVKTSSGAALATATVGTPAASAAAASVRAVAAASAARTVKVTLKRARGARGALRAWACATPARDAAQPCSPARALVRRATLRLPAAPGQRVRIVVVRGGAAAK